MKKFFKKVIDIVFILTIIGVLALLLANYFGFKIRVVKSGSMEPVIMTGDIAVVNENVPFDMIEVGDVIAFRIATGEMVTHRVIDMSKIDGQKWLMTKGDNVEIADGYTTTIQNYYGKTVYSFGQPKFSDQKYLSDVLNSKQGKVFVAAIGIALILLSILLDEDEAPIDKLRQWLLDYHPDMVGEYDNYIEDTKDRKKQREEQRAVREARRVRRRRQLNGEEAPVNQAPAVPVVAAPTQAPQTPVAAPVAPVEQQAAPAVQTAKVEAPAQAPVSPVLPQPEKTVEAPKVEEKPVEAASVIPVAPAKEETKAVPEIGADKEQNDAVAFFFPWDDDNK